MNLIETYPRPKKTHISRRVLVNSPSGWTSSSKSGRGAFPIKGSGMASHKSEHPAQLCICHVGLNVKVYDLLEKSSPLSEDLLFEYVFTRLLEKPRFSDMVNAGDWDPTVRDRFESCHSIASFAPTSEQYCKAFNMCCSMQFDPNNGDKCQTNEQRCIPLEHHNFVKLMLRVRCGELLQSQEKKRERKGECHSYPTLERGTDRFYTIKY
ncbi:hypothetical protein DICVIV_00008 [Dictyocaulus viviparus]|uniref:Uncharacterized protein n=1 Tax=Dictyocaulus viviparus TaxID=29172 RepID=A0A0D8YA00_DICVI|nr:hypothetical protein DICVIV_00008 [Dictyocaulus viviparus]